MAEQYIVTGFRMGAQDNYGNQIYYVDTDKVQDAYYATKNKPPVIGQSFEWELSHSDKGPRFRNPQQQQGAAGGGQPSGGGSRGGGYKADPDKDKRILRQHTQKVAGDLGYDPKKNLAEFQDVCDLLCQDVESYVGSGAPAAALPNLDSMRQQLQADLTENNLSLEEGAAAIAALYGRPTLEVTDSVDAIIGKAKELSSNDIPF